MAKLTRRTNTRRTRKSPIALPDEKSVRDTNATVAVKPPKISRKAQERIAPVAVDRRRQVIQTDEEINDGACCPPAKRARRR
jgi:hypothetical protein